MVNSPDSGPQQEEIGDDEPVRTREQQSEDEEDQEGGRADAESSSVKNLKRSVSNAADLRGLFQLATDAVTLTTRLVEAAHSRFDPFSNSWLYPTHETDRAGGLAGTVYNTIHAVNGAVGTGFDTVISQFQPLLGERTDCSPNREQTLAVLNGVVGDYLEERNNPLAIQMECRVNGIVQTDQMLTDRIHNSDGRLLVLVHGSCSTDLQWSQGGHDHGASIASEVGITPIYIHYNSGLHVSENGKLLALQMDRLMKLADEERPPKMYILAHSMGGLVVRSACHYATVHDDQFNANKWLKQVQKIIFLGTPHHGAVLERGGKWVDYLLSMHRYSEPFSWIGKIRSKGVTDLGYGNVRDEDWHGHSSGTDDRRQPTPLPNDVQCYAIAAVASSSDNSNHFHTNIVGDGLVAENSALGQGHSNTELNLLIPSSHQRTIPGVSHVGLLGSILVYQAIKSFLVASN